MSLRINDPAPDFSADTTEGQIWFHDWIGDSWVILFSHPKDFTPVCTTELSAMAGMKDEFAKRNCKLIGLSVDPVRDHHTWKKDIEAYGGIPVDYPLIGDPDLRIAQQYDMLPADLDGSCEGRSAVDNQTARSVFIIAPDTRIKAILTYPMSSGRNFTEILRLLDSCQLTVDKQLVTPANWVQGDPVIIAPSVSNETAKERFPDGWEAPLPYLRIVTPPTD